MFLNILKRVILEFLKILIATYSLYLLKNDA